MTIQDAIKSGKYFHRPKHKDDIFDVRLGRLWTAFLDYSEEPPVFMFSEPEYSGFERLNADDLLADDWITV